MYHPKHDEVKAVQKLYAAERKSHEDTLKNILGEISLMRHNTQEAAKILFQTTKKLDGLIELLLTIQGKEEPNSGKPKIQGRADMGAVSARVKQRLAG